MFASGNIISQMVFGERFDSMDNPDYVTIVKGWTAFFHTSAPAFQVTYILHWHYVCICVGMFPTYSYSSIQKAAMISPYLLYLPIIRQYANAVTVGLGKVSHGAYNELTQSNQPVLVFKAHRCC